MQPLYERYKQRGFEIAAFPCNQFRNQEPGTNAEIKKFVREKFGGTYDLYAKIDVNGDGAHPLYKFLKQKQGGILGFDEIKWNFSKFLINRQGVPVERYAPLTDYPSIEPDIITELDKSESGSRDEH